MPVLSQGIVCRRHTRPACAAAGLWCAAMLLAGVYVQRECGAAESGDANFKQVLNENSKRTFKAVADYAAQNGKAADVDEAYLWMFQNAVDLDLEAEALDPAEAYLGRKDGNPDIRNLAVQVRTLALAKVGRPKESLEEFGAFLKSARRSRGEGMLQFGMILARQLQLNGDFDAVREVYELLSSAFPLNGEVRKLAEERLNRLELIGKAAPKVDGDDLEDKAFTLADYKGKVVLIDFWATWCQPCLAEIPNLQQIYADNHEKGFEIIGISLDDDAGTVEEFQKQVKLPWRLMMNDAGDDDEFNMAYSANSIPALFLVDQKGKIVQFDLRGADLRTAVEKLLQAPTKTGP